MNFIKIDQSKHPDTELFIKKVVLKNSYSEKYSKKIFDEIKKINKYFRKKNGYGGTWEWIDKNVRGTSIEDSFFLDSLLKERLKNFFRNEFSFGIISSHWEKKNKKDWKKKIASDILKNLDAWNEFTKENDQEYKFLDNKKDPGNPYGLRYNNKLILYDTPRHDYFAKKIINLFSEKKIRPVIVEIGGGYGGLFNQLLKRKFKFKYINVDLINTLITNYYYIKSLNKNCNIIFKNKLNKLDLKKNDYFFIPYSNDIFTNLKFKSNLVFNCNSFSEMDSKILNKYFRLLNNILRPDYLLHQNSNVLLYPKSNLHVEIQSNKFPINKSKYKMIYSNPSLFQGGSGRYREYLYIRK